MIRGRAITDTPSIRTKPSWPLVPLASVARVYAGSAAPQGKEMFAPDGPPFVRVSDLGRFGRTTELLEVRDRLSRACIDAGGLVLSRAGTILFPKSGAAIAGNNRAILGMDAYVVSHLMCVEPGPQVASEWIYFWLCQVDMMRVADNAAYPSLKQSEVARLLLPLPPLAEQKRIAAALTSRLSLCAQALAASGERLIAAQHLPMASVVGVFGSTAARSWPQRPLGEIVLGSGQYGTSQKSVPTELPGTLPVLGIGNVKMGKIDWTRLKFGEFSAEDAAKYCLEEGDLLFVRTNSAELVGETAVFDGTRKAAFASYLVRFRVNPALADPRFISTYINSPWGRHFIQQNLGRAIGQANVSASTMAAMRIPVPPLKLQRELMDKLDWSRSHARAVEELICQEQAALALIPAALLRQAFNGD